VKWSEQMQAATGWP